MSKRYAMASYSVLLPDLQGLKQGKYASPAEY